MVRTARFAVALASAALGAALVSAAVVEKPAAAAAVKNVGPVVAKSVIEPKKAGIPVVPRQADDVASPGITGGFDVAVEPETSADLLIPESPEKVFMDKVKEATPADRKPMLDVLKKGSAEKVDEKLAEFKEGVIEEVMEQEDEVPESSSEELIEDEADDDFAGEMGDEGDDFEEDGLFEEGADQTAELDDEFEAADEMADEIEGPEGDAPGPDDMVEPMFEDDFAPEDAGEEVAMLDEEMPGMARTEDKALKAAAVAAAESVGPEMSVEAWEEVKDQAKEKALSKN